MKHLLLLFIVSFISFSCANKNGKDSSQNTVQIEGEFIYVADAAVIKGNDFIYGVELNATMHELAEKVAPLQREAYDMVPVVVKGIIKPNPEEGWEEILEIKEIVEVKQPTSLLPTKVQSKDTL
ncbi:hypothetical protein ACJRPK_02220 [Aquimarina sp. 2-A2]|uniref:NlpE-like protein n=1 Tax=Aquimarina intermedia TaxID=350814 RepID=A0A5S5CC56_9FLAO|nr:hypothetical protein [Aquimarina intermedia]TYP76944.1 hypothetical protein BD809_10190 [Aquimarina intermedia]